MFPDVYFWFVEIKISSVLAVTTTAPVNPPTKCPSLARSYMESFTIHGLSKVFVGKLWERLFWGSVLVAVLGFLSFKTHGFHTQYKNNDFRTEIRMVDVIANFTWPEIKMCSKVVEDKLFGQIREGRWARKQYDFCFKNVSLGLNLKKKMTCHKPEYVKFTEYTFTRKKINYEYDYMSPTQCVQLNISKITKDSSKRVFQFSIRVDKESFETDLDNESDAFSIHIEGDPIKKTVRYGKATIFLNNLNVIKRLPSPFKSNCSNGKGGLNVFPGRYTREKCALTLQFKRMLRHCGDVPSHWKPYVKPHHVKGWDFEGHNQTEKYVLDCIGEYYTKRYREEDYYTADFYQCPLPCYEIFVESYVKQDKTYTSEAIKNTGLETRLSSILSTRITEVQEIATYTSDNFFSDVGSWLGLLVGMSFLSIVEIAAFIFTVLRERCS